MLENIITSSVLIAVLILLRYFLKGKINLRLQYALWLLVAIKLLVPFSILDSPLSVLNIVDTGSRMQRIENPAVLTVPESIERTNTNIGEEITGDLNSLEIPRNSVQDGTIGSAAASHEKTSWKDILHNVWQIGAITAGFWFVLQNIWFYLKLRKTREAVEIPGRLPVYLSRYVKSPCLFGLFRPAIYINPSCLCDDQALKHILAHEETHYRHRDHFWSYLRCLCLALHWFNPLVWWAAVLSRRDCELACDESTLSRLGDEHRKAYGNTLISMIVSRVKPSDLLSGATTMTSGQGGIKERITMIAKKPKMLISTLLAVIFVMAVAVGCTFTGANGNYGKDVTLYERAGVTIAIPNEYAGQLLIDPLEYDDETTLIQIYQKSTYEKYEGAGLLFSITRYSEAQYEQFLSSDGSGQSFFAKDDTSYYGFFFATDVQAPDDYEAFSLLFSAVGDYVKSDMITRNGLTAYSDDEFFNKPYTYDSEHIFLSYYPYYAYNGSKEEVWTLILSQPATQGDAGIWCVERWKDQNGMIYPYFPDENGTPSVEYYAKRQAECDSGSDMSWLDPKQVALAFVKRVFDHTPATLDSILISDNPAFPADLFAVSTGNIHDYMPGLLTGRAVSDYELLPCLENFTHATWPELDEAYGRDWWNPLWEALRDAAVSDGRSQHDYGEQSLRDYYLGKAILAADGAYTEGLTDILALQWDYDKALYSACLLERFSAEEAASLRQFLLYSLKYSGDIFGLHNTPGTGGALYLNVYPVDFPFGFDLAEQSRESFRAESFGPGAVVESDGLQVTFLNPYEGVYTVTIIRAVKKGYSAAGVAIGDSEETLLEKWHDKSLKKLNSISYDDEAWFGECNLAYTYTPEESTKSLVYLIKEGMVSGIELINGLDGAIY